MSNHAAFRRQPVPAQAAAQMQVTSIPAPTRGIIQSENDAFMQPGAAVVLDNWMPTMQGVRLRGGCVQWADLSAAGLAQWENAHAYVVGSRIYDAAGRSYWDSTTIHTSPASPMTFAAYRAANPAVWVNQNAAVDLAREPVISAFEYSSGILHRMFAANSTKLCDVTFTGPPTLVKGGQQSGNYAASQMANAAGDWLIVVNDAGDYPLRFDGTSWEVMNAAYVPSGGKPSKITVDMSPGKYPNAKVQNGQNLSYVCKYRNRLYFIELNSMNAWYLPLNAVGGNLEMIPLSGAATKGGHLLFCATWSLDAGDGVDDKLCFVTNLGEILIFTGSDPANPSNWRQEGRFEIPSPMGMNAHILVGGDLLIATVTGIVPTSAAITKEGGQLELAAVTRNIKRMWREHVVEKREWAWTMKAWPEFGAIFVTVPGGAGIKKMCLAVNDATGAWARMVGYDATCFIKNGNNFYFGTQAGLIMQADRGGYDNGIPYTATLVGGWNALSTQPGTSVWTQARAAFVTKSGEPFDPQLSACTDFIIKIPPPLPARADVGVDDVWDEGKWGDALWDQASTKTSRVTTTGWVSIGITGFSHAPIIQVTVGQIARPNVELISIDAAYHRGGVNV